MTDAINSNEELNATQLDAQRARHLLDRALGLSERGDVAGAIVTCRQSLALAPNLSQGWSMLGLLHEQDHDIEGAIEAYEKVLSLSPNSMLERESLQRLRQERGKAPRPAPKFNFDKLPQGKPVAGSADSAITHEALLAPGIEEKFTAPLWHLFYFRSLPLLATAVGCVIFLLVAQGIAARRHPAMPVNDVSKPANPKQGSTLDGDTNVMPPPPEAASLPPSALAPPKAPLVNSAAADAEMPAPASNDEDESPEAKPQSQSSTATPKPKPEPPQKPRTPSAPRASIPTEMPVLPAPRISLPEPDAPAPVTSPASNEDNEPADNRALSGNGPIDVGNSENSKYIPINPPQFPDPRR